MKKMTNLHNHKYITAICLLFLAFLHFSCKKFVDVGAPLSEVESSKVFANDQATLSAALGVYANMGLSNLYICSGGATLYPGLSADELTYTSSNTELLSFQHNAIIANNGTGIYSRLWVPAYSNIYNANAILEGLISSSGLSDTLKSQIKGEMLVVRSLNYFYLINLFGDVPLELTTNYQVNSTMARTPTDKIYTQLIADLKTASLLLNSNYPSSVNTRPNKWTAMALLARIYLYQKDWTDAVATSSAVINSSQYNLESNLGNVFLEGSAETIWQLANDYHNTGEASAFVPYSSSSTPSYTINSYLLSAFEPGDQRMINWLGKNTVNGVTYYYPYKYQNRSYSPITEFEVMFRLAEQYLIRAEAEAQLGDLNSAAADLNIIRNRAGLPNTTAAAQSTLLTAIASERQVELFCEWGHRWLDLKRTGQANAVLGLEKAPYWNPTVILYPIPLSELQLNPNLVQNPGY